ncbi:DNA circularization protein [Paraburkholderia sp. BR14320]|uniref:DNA circularization protein n=1 Tax=unclassified Paraburkholderia TaxID=2615204 RepID=UPI0034CD39CE
MSNSVVRVGTNLLSVAGSIGGVAQGAANLAGDVSTLLGGTPEGWTPRLLKASYGGLPFAVEATRTVAGRRYAVHEYPFREGAWLEDMGRLPNRWEVNGYLVEDSLIYQGGPVIAQRDRLFALCVARGANRMVHPTFGGFDNVVCLSVEFSEALEAGRVIEVKFVFMLAGLRINPASSTSTADDVFTKALPVGIAADLDFARNAATLVIGGAATIQQYVATAVGWYQIAVTAIGDVKSVIGAVSALYGNFGRFFGGANYGYTGGANPTARPEATANDLLVAASMARAAVVSAGDALEVAAANPSDAAALSAAAQTLTGALAETASDPADAVRLVSSLCRFRPPPIRAQGPFGACMQGAQDAMAALLRRCALAQLAATLTTYQPASQNDANTVLSDAAALFDDEITIAGDAGDDNSYAALRALREAVCTDLAARGADLSVIATFQFRRSLPSLALALRIYRDASREPELTQQINPRHPAFCPPSFQALAS